MVCPGRLKVETPKQNEGLSNGGKLSWPTVVLIIATGGANLLQTHQGNAGLSFEQREALDKIRQIHSQLDDFERRQTEELELLKRLEQSK